jgi:hypothetical protein
MNTRDDKEQIQLLKRRLKEEFEVKYLGQLKYFLRSEIMISIKGMMLSQQKYALDLLSEIKMLGYRIISTPLNRIIIYALTQVI